MHIKTNHWFFFFSLLSVVAAPDERYSKQIILFQCFFSRSFVRCHCRTNSKDIIFTILAMTFGWEIHVAIHFRVTTRHLIRPMHNFGNSVGMKLAFMIYRQSLISFSSKRNTINSYIPGTLRAEQLCWCCSANIPNIMKKLHPYIRWQRPLFIQIPIQLWHLYWKMSTHLRFNIGFSKK